MHALFTQSPASQERKTERKPREKKDHELYTKLFLPSPSVRSVEMTQLNNQKGSEARKWQGWQNTTCFSACRNWGFIFNQMLLLEKNDCLQRQGGTHYMSRSCWWTVGRKGGSENHWFISSRLLLGWSSVCLMFLMFFSIITQQWAP